MNLYDRCEPIPMSGCLIWTGATIRGYGCVRHLGKTFYAHRLSYESAYGKIPEGMHVLHKCDVPSCINPLHLSVGTNADNIADSVSKGRRKGVKRNRPIGLKYNVPAGAHDSKLKISRDKWPLVLSRIASGEKITSLAKEFNVNRTTIGNIVRRSK